CALGDHDDGMSAFRDASFERGQKSILPIQLEGQFRNQGKVHILACDSSSDREKTSVPPHYFHQGNPILHAPSFRVSTAQHFFGLLNCGEVTEAARYKRDVVIDCLGNTDHCKRVTTLPGFLEKSPTSTL